MKTIIELKKMIYNLTENYRKDLSRRRISAEVDFAGAKAEFSEYERIYERDGAVGGGFGSAGLQGRVETTSKELERIKTAESDAIAMVKIVVEKFINESER